MDVFEEEAARAQLYRDRWDARIQYRRSQLQRLAGSHAALEQLWETYAPVFRKDNYIQATPVSSGEDGGYQTPFDVDDNGSVSSSTIRLRGTRHASDQNNREHG
jgi:hypothetical protein